MEAACLMEAGLFNGGGLFNGEAVVMISRREEMKDGRAVQGSSNCDESGFSTTVTKIPIGGTRTPF